MLGPVPPWLESMLSRSNAPGAPVLPSGRVVRFVLPKQGHVEVPLSFGLRMLTPIGATYFAWSIRLARAEACDPTVTVRTPKSLVKTPLAGLLTLTLTVSFVRYLVEKLTAGVPPPFLVTYCWLRVFALVGLDGRAWAPASAAASAVDCVARSARYHDPMSSTSAAMPSRTTRKTSVRIVAWPRSL